MPLDPHRGAFSLALASVLIALTITVQPMSASSDCLWEAIGPTQRQAWLGRYIADPRALMTTVVEADVASDLATTCRVPVDKVRNLLVARTMELGAEAWWDREMQQPGALARSWAALTEAERVQLRRWAASAIDDGNGDEVEMTSFPAFAQGAGLKDPNGPGMMHVMGNMLGRGYRELAGS